MFEFQKGQLQIQVKKEINELEKNTELEEKEKLEKIFAAEKRMKEIKKRAIGNVLFIGWLFRRSMLSEKIMHGCIISLFQEEDEEHLEALCKLFETIGKLLDKKGRKKEDTKKQMEVYFNNLNNLTGKDKKLPNRVKFMIYDLIDLRNNQWVPRREKAQTSKSKAQIQAEARKEEQEALLRQAEHRNNNRNRNQSNDYRNNNQGNNRGGRGNHHNRSNGRGRQGPSKPPPVQDLRPFNPRGGNANRMNNNNRNSNSNNRASNSNNSSSQNRRPNNDNMSSSSSNNKKTMSLDKMKKSLKSTVKEYLMIEDLNELKECLKELPSDMEKEAYFVGTCAEIAINEKESNRRKIFKLMGDVTKDKVLSEAQIAFSD